MAHSWFFQNSRICRSRGRTKTYLHWNHVGLVFAVRNGSKNVQEVYIVYGISLAHAHHPFSPCSLSLAHGLNGLHKPSNSLLGVEMGRCGSWVRLGCYPPGSLPSGLPYAGCTPAEGLCSSEGGHHHRTPSFQLTPQDQLGSSWFGGYTSVLCISPFR